MGWRQRQAFEFASTQQTADVLLPELISLLPHYTMCFMQQNDGYILVALLGLGGDRNLYVNNENYWMCQYVPASLRSYPFTLADNSETGEKVFCIEESHITDDSDATFFFDNDDNLANETATVFGFLSQCENSRETTQKACNALADAGLITPWEINLKQGEKVVPVEGLYSVDEAALNKLDDEDFLAVRKAGGLGVAYAQLLSMNQLVVLERLDEIQGQILAQTANSEAANLTGFSLGEDEGSLMFE
jgi:hypothetical protein